MNSSEQLYFFCVKTVDYLAVIQTKSLKEFYTF